MSWQPDMAGTRVVSSYPRLDGKGNIRIVCTFSNGAVWSCDESGKDWERYMPSNEELTHSFDAFMGPPPPGTI